MGSKHSQLDDARRLQLITEAVRYCKRVKGMGMPPSCYTKALREPIYFLWTKKSGQKKADIARYRSKNSLELNYGSGQIVLDHAIPFNYLQERLLSVNEVTPQAVEEILKRYDTYVLITKDEDRSLGKYKDKMPEGWDEIDHYARYKAVGIDLVENIDGAARERRTA